MKKRKLTIEKCIKSLSKKKDCKIMGTMIYRRVGKKQVHDLGNGSWGKIDFLTRHCHFTLLKVEEYPSEENHLEMIHALGNI
jgi:hypothetical protein